MHPLLSAQYLLHVRCPLCLSSSQDTTSANTKAISTRRELYLKLRAMQSWRPWSFKPEVKVLPAHYESAEPYDLVVLISSMINELIQFNEQMAPHHSQQTRFHSCSPPEVSVHDYLQRLTTHAQLSPPILLSMVYYLHWLCILYPAFTVSSLSIHRFLVVSTTVASKALSDSFWTNKTYARIGGISTTELGMLELDFLFNLEWKIFPEPEVLVDYYQHLVARCEGFKIDDSNPSTCTHR